MSRSPLLLRRGHKMTVFSGGTRIRGWIKARWQKQPLLIGYSGQIVGTANMVAAAPDPDLLSSGAVPANEIWVIQNISAYHNDPVARIIQLVLVSGGVQYIIDMKTTLTANNTMTYQGALIMDEGDTLLAKFYSVVAPTNLRITWIGMRVDIDQ